MSTYFPSGNTIETKWFVVDAEGEVLGRLAARVALLLRGKSHAHYTPFMDTGEHVLIINAAKIKLTGQKLEQKEYHHFTGFPGGLKTQSMKVRMAKHPEDVLRDAILGMLPKNRLGKQAARKLRIYADARHPHTAQTPERAEGLVKA